MGNTDKILKVIGLSVGAEFDIKDYLNNPYTFSEELIATNKFGNEMTHSLTVSILTGETEIVVPWKPKSGDEIWSVHPSGEVYWATFNPAEINHVYRLMHGNFFKTKEEAESHKTEILDKFAELLG